MLLVSSLGFINVTADCSPELAFPREATGSRRFAAKRARRREDVGVRSRQSSRQKGNSRSVPAATEGGRNQETLVQRRSGGSATTPLIHHTPPYLLLTMLPEQIPDPLRISADQLSYVSNLIAP